MYLDRRQRCRRRVGLQQLRGIMQQVRPAPHIRIPPRHCCSLSPTSSTTTPLNVRNPNLTTKNSTTTYSPHNPNTPKSNHPQTTTSNHHQITISQHHQTTTQHHKSNSLTESITKPANTDASDTSNGNRTLPERLNPNPRQNPKKPKPCFK